MNKVRKYDKAFKEQVVKLIKESAKSMNEISRELEIPLSTIAGWVKQVDKHKKDAFPGKGNIHNDDEIKKLQKENLDLRLENEILKKATAIFIKPR